MRTPIPKVRTGTLIGMNMLVNLTAAGGTVAVTRERDKVVLKISGGATADELLTAFTRGQGMWDTHFVLSARARLARGLRRLAGVLDPRSPTRPRPRADDDGAAAQDARKPNKPAGPRDSAGAALEAACNAVARAGYAAFSFVPPERPVTVTTLAGGGIRIEVGDASLSLSAAEFSAINSSAQRPVAVRGAS